MRKKTFSSYSTNNAIGLRYKRYSAYALHSYIIQNPPNNVVYKRTITEYKTCVNKARR